MTTTINCLDSRHGTDWTLYRGDCVDVVRQMPDCSVDFSVYSPPFANLYTYSDSERDMGNCEDDAEFLEHYAFLVRELYRCLRPGRLVAVHCKDLVNYKSSAGMAGLRDFPGDLIRVHQAAGFAYHSRVTVWKCPVTEQQRTKAHGLLYKQLRKDSTFSRQGLAEYVLVFRKWARDEDQALVERVGHTFESFPLERWQEWASPVWMDIDQTDVLNTEAAREDRDSKHMCLARGSLVLTRGRGYVPIQEIVPHQDEVLTHRGRWRPVLAVQNTGVQETISVHAQGVPGLTLTPDHKLWLRRKDCARARDGAERAEPTWCPSGEALGGYLNLKLPPEEAPRIASTDHWWIVGRWLADGHWEARGGVQISAGRHEASALIAALGARAGAVHETPTCVQIRVLDPDGTLRETLERCGAGASGKHLPPEAFTLPVEQATALLDGYLSGDGHFLPDRQRWMASSVSRALLLGIAALAQRVHGAIACVYAGRGERAAEIQGRNVKCRQDWILSFDIGPRRKKPFLLEDGAWKKVRAIRRVGTTETWNLRVADDESFTAEGCVVKNCPLQLDLIERCLTLWSNPGNVVLSPFAGVGSEGHVSLRLGRKFVGVELKESYFLEAARNLSAARAQLGLFGDA